jgi:hypothetical protein
VDLQKRKKLVLLARYSVGNAKIALANTLKAHPMAEENLFGA